MKRFGPSSRLWRIVKKAGADSVREKKIRNLLEQDRFVCGYVPYIPGKTDIILYNFFGINYGCRSGLTLLISLVDKNFAPLRTDISSLSYRQSLYIKNVFEGEGDLMSGSHAFVVIALFSPSFRPRISSNHLRFWGLWDNNVGTHSWPLPSFKSFIKNFLGIKHGFAGERKFFPYDASKIIEYKPFVEPMLQQKRGDLSGIDLSPPGYTFLFDERDSVVSVYHGQVYNRKFSPVQDSCDFSHVVALPLADKISAQLWFGECCTSGSVFTAELFKSSDNPSLKAVCVARTEIVIEDASTPILVDSVFNGFAYERADYWIEFTPLSGGHRDYYINTLYVTTKDNDKTALLDSIHSHSFCKSSKVRRSRALKFFPFTLSEYQFDNNSFCIPKLAIWGGVDADVTARLRILSISDPDFEFVLPLNVIKKQVNFIHLDDYSKYIPISASTKPLIAQLECDHLNLQASLFQSEIKCSQDFENTKVVSFLSDHLTGG